MTRDISPVRGQIYGASREEWLRLAATGQVADLLPVVCNPTAEISPRSRVAKPCEEPCKYTRDGYLIGFKRWSRIQADEKLIATWSKHDDYGVCIQTRDVRAIHVDIKDAALAAVVFDFIESVNPGLPMRFRPDSSEFLFAVRVPGYIPTHVVHTAGGDIAFLGDGQQFMAAGTHRNGYRYQWRGGMPNAFPEITRARFDELKGDLHMFFGISEPSTFAATVANNPTRILSGSAMPHFAPDPARPWVLHVLRGVPTVWHCLQRFRQCAPCSKCIFDRTRGCPRSIPILPR